MPRDLSVGVTAEIAGEVVQPVFLVAIEHATGTLRLWTGYGTLTWDGDDYTGAGTLIGIAPAEESTDLQASGTKYTLSGISSEAISLALSNFRQGLDVNLWLGFMAGDGTLMADPLLIDAKIADQPSVDESGETCTLSLTAESRAFDHERRRVRRLTPEDQKLVDASDKGFDYVASLVDASIPWGREAD